MSLTKDVKASSLSNHISSSSYVAMMILIGVPVWWKTTEVYRASLPFSDIDELSEVTGSQVFSLLIVTEDLEEADMRAPSINKLLSTSTVYKPTLYTKLLTEREANLLENVPDMATVDDLIGADIFKDNPGCIAMVQVPSRLFTNVPHLVIGNHRTVYFSSYLPSEDLVRVLMDIMLGEPQMITTARSLSVSSQVRPPPTDSARKRSTGHVDLFLTLLVPQPEHVSASWDISAATQTKLMPFLDNFPLNFTVKSQVVYLTPLNIPVGEDLTPEQLGLAVNSVETVLASQSSNSPGLNLLVYIPPVERSPMLVSGSSTNSFIVPRWGGVHIYNYNLETENTKFPLSLHVDMDKVVGIWLGQLRDLLGVEKISDDFSALPVPTIGLRKWERDFQLRHRGLENLLDSVSTLSSLSHLLSHIHNIVIREEIGDVVTQAVEKAAVSASLAGSHGNLVQSHEASVEAIQLAETAFFDQSLLALLYFPDDQRYAIYIPFFLPVGIPVILSIRTLFKFVKSELKKQS